MNHWIRRLGALRALPLLLVPVACGTAGAGSEVRGPEPEAERVEVGYGSQTRAQLTGAVSSLTSAELDRERVSRIEELLEDRIPGVMVSRRPDGSMSIRIRGTRSLMGGNEPLVVIDGTPITAFSVSQALTGLAPQSVERIDVLKDAGSTAAYGSRGANGVILITTRRGGSR